MFYYLSCILLLMLPGFNWLLDITYPFTTQSLVFDGRNIMLCAYQLNTLQLWQNSNSETNKQNIAWISEEMPLLEYDEHDGHVTDINDAALALLVKSLLLEPTERDRDLRPYLPNDPSPRFKRKYFNHVGKEQFEARKIERHEFPSNSTYYYSHLP